MAPFEFRPGRIPLLVSMPHVGLGLSPGLTERLVPEARDLPDTDWHLPRLYDFLDEVGASVLIATHSRYVIDLNRPPDDKPLYAGATTGLCPDTLFDGSRLYREGQAPDAAERARRLETYWRPYHDKIAATLEAMRAEHGVAVLFDAHSIRSEVPRLFDGRLPDLNFGTNDGASVGGDIAQRLLAACAGAPQYTHVLNGRFKGGYITRHYGQPDRNIHAVQLEMSQIVYMDEDRPFGFREDLAQGIRPVLRSIVGVLAEAAQA